MREAQHATMTQTYTVMYKTNSGPINAITNNLFRRPVSETPAVLGPDSCFLKTCRRNACRSGASHWRAPLPQSFTQTKGSSDITAKWFGNRCKNIAWQLYPIFTMSRNLTQNPQDLSVAVCGIFPSCWRLVPIMSRGPGCLTFLWGGGCCEWRPLS